MYKPKGRKMFIMTIVMVALFIGCVFAFDKRKWLLTCILVGLFYGSCIIRNEAKISDCSEYLVHDEIEYIEEMQRNYGDIAKGFEQLMLQYSEPLCIQMNQVWYYNAGFMHKRYWKK